MSNFRRWARVPGLLCLLVSCGGCFCYSARDALLDTRAPRHEFREMVLMHAAPLPGVCAGTLETNGVMYSRYQFTNVLAGGQARVLDLLVAGNQAADSIVAESTRRKPESEPAFLLLQHMAGDYSPAQYFQQHYPGEDPKFYSSRTIYLDVYGDAHWELYLLCENPATGQLEWTKTQAQDQLAWVMRSRTAYALGHLRYLYAVPLDIITSPYQLFVMLKLSHG